MTNRIATLAFLLVACVAVPATATARCESSSIIPRDNQTVTGKMIVKAGATCSALHGLSAGPMLSTVIAKRPVHGKATVRYSHNVVYLAPRGYTGPDTFTYIRRGLDALDRPAVRTVNVVVAVVP
jgi:hypothetical protein